jgi:hypothetical protein
MEETGVAMITWAENLYISEDLASKRKSRLIKAIEKGRLTFAVYCITFASNPDNLFDILNANELLFPYYKKKDMHIIGLAPSREAAILLVKDMIEEIYGKTGDFRVREYF